MAARLSFAEYCYQETVGKGLDPMSLDLEQARREYELIHPELKTCVFLDDERVPTAQIAGYDHWMLVRSFAEWVEYLSIKGPPDLVSFDHDLAPEHYADWQKYELQGIAAIEYESFKVYTGFHCAQYYAAFCEQNELTMKSVGVHCTERPMGAHNIREAVNEYKKAKGLAADCYIAAVPSRTIGEIQAQKATDGLIL